MSLAKLLTIATAGTMVAAQLSRRKADKSGLGRTKPKKPACTPCEAAAYVQGLRQFSNAARGDG